MRLLHTSDWHLGRTFHGESLLAEQHDAVDRLVDLATQSDVELIVIAGDLYDRAIPPTEAVSLFGDALVRLRDTGAAVVAIAGNHDSATRIGVNDRLLAHANVTVRGDAGRLVQPLTLIPDDGGPPVAVYPVPYLEPSLAGPVLTSLGHTADDADDRDETPRRLSHHAVTARATALIRAHAASTGPIRTVVVAHTFVSGGTTSESERDLTVGNIDLVDLSAFDGFSYVALGHLHGDQAWDDGRVAYSGTPLPYSFSEEHHTKSARIVELGADGACHTEVVPLGIGRPLRTLRGTLDDLLRLPGFSDAEQARVRVQLTDADLPMQAMRRLQQRFPHAVVLHHEPEGRAVTGIGDVASAVRNSQTPLELTQRFWADQHHADATDEQVAVLADALSAATGESGR